MQNSVFSCWMGPGDMSEPRTKALLSMIENLGVPHAHLNRQTLANWIIPEFPIHPAFFYLSAVHQCDYLRCYLMHVYGGGYADIKPTQKNWFQYFVQLKNSDKFGVGYTEVGPQGVAEVGGELEAEMKLNFRELVGVCAIIFKPRSQFTYEWFDLLHDLLNRNYYSLVENPAKHPQDRFGAEFSDGSISKYPLAWTAVGGDIFHPLVYKYRGKFIHADIAPSFSNYR